MEDRESESEPGLDRDFLPDENDQSQNDNQQALSSTVDPQIHNMQLDIGLPADDVSVLEDLDHDVGCYPDPVVDQMILNPPNNLANSNDPLQSNDPRFTFPQTGGNISPVLQKCIENNRLLGTVIHKPIPEQECSQEDDTNLSMIRLIDYCDKSSQKGRGFLDGLLKILSEEMSQRKFNPATAPKAETVRKHVMKNYNCKVSRTIGRFRMSAAENPYLITDPDELKSRDRDTLDCVVFDIERNTIDLLNDIGLVGNLDNLVVNKTDPFMPYDGTCDEVLGGSWHRDSLQRLKESEEGFNPTFEFKLDYIFYADKTGTCDNQRYPLEPFTFTFALFKREVRYNPRAWRPLGFIPDLETKSSYENKYIRSQNKSAISQSYHTFLSFLLQGFQKIQDRGIITWLQLGNQIKCVRLRPEFAFIIGDGKSADMLTSRFGGHIKGATRISRSCWTKQKECDNLLKEHCHHIQLSDRLTDSRVNKILKERHEDQIRAKVLAGKKENKNRGKTEEQIRAQVKASMGPAPKFHSKPEMLRQITAKLGKEVVSSIIDQKVQTDLSDPTVQEAMHLAQATSSEVLERYPELHHLCDRFEERNQQKPPEKRKSDARLAAMEIAKGIVQQRREALEKCSFQPVRNAFLARCIRFGLDPRNIWGANPTDLMHAFQSGLLMYMTKMALDKLGNKNRAQLDSLVDRILGTLRSSERQFFPRFSFTKGFSKVSMITSDEWAKKLFVLLLIAHTAEGHAILCKTFDKQKRMKEIPDDFGNWPLKDQIKKYQETAERLNKAAREKNKETRDMMTLASSRMMMGELTQNQKRRRKSYSKSATGRSSCKCQRLFCASMLGTSSIQLRGSPKPTPDIEPSW
jgi:hypothetical protein